MINIAELNAYTIFTQIKRNDSKGKRFVKDAMLSLPLTDIIKIARLTSPPLGMPRLSSPRPKLRHGKRLALLFHPSLTLNLFSLFFALSLALLPHLPPLLTSPTLPLPGSRLRSTPPS